MKTRSNPAILVVVFMLVSCSSSVVTPTIQPSPQETNTPLLPTQTITPIPSATITPGISISKECINFDSTGYNSNKIDGLLAVSSREGYHLLDPKTNQFVDLDENGNPIYNLLRISLSPNRKYMLALTNTDEYFVVKTIDRLITTNIPISMGSRDERWLDNEHIAFRGKDLSNQELTIVNPFTEEKKTIRLELPNIKDWPLLGSTYSIDPTMKRAFYNDKDDRLILWNVETQQEMAFLPSTLRYWLPEFAWSRDGKKFITASPLASRDTLLANELYVFDMDGNLEKLTDLNSRYGFANIDSPAWSPDGRHIGFWLNTGDGSADEIHRQYWLAFVDVNTLETRVSCLTNTWPWRVPLDNIVWSPDGQQLIVSFGSWTDDTTTTFLVDLTDQTQTIIDTRNMYVYDWMVP